MIIKMVIARNNFSSMVMACESTDSELSRNVRRELDEYGWDASAMCLDTGMYDRKGIFLVTYEVTREIESPYDYEMISCECLTVLSHFQGMVNN